MPMHFTIEKEILQKTLNAANKGIGPKSPIPQLLCFKIEMTSSELQITSSNSDLAVFAKIPAETEGHVFIRNFSLGAILITAPLLVGVISKLTGKELTLEIVDERIAKISDGRSNYRIPCSSANEYPDIDMNRIGTPFTIPCTAFASLVESTAFAAYERDGNPVLTSLNLRAENGRLTATATDSARLSQKQIPIDNNLRFSANIPAKTLTDVVRLFDNSYDLEVVVGDKKVIMSFGNITVSCRIIPDSYPVSSSILPKSFSYRLTVSKNELLEAIERVSVLSTDRAAVIKLSMSEDDVEVSCSNDINGSGVEHLSEARFEGERLEITFNSLYVTQAVRALGSDDILLRFQGEMKPFVVENPEDDTVVDLITPMRTR